MTITALDIEQGDAVLLDFGFSRGGCGTEWLVDGGPAMGRLGERIAPHLGSACDLDAVVLTHPHVDHFVGLRQLFREDVTIAGFFTNGEAPPLLSPAGNPTAWGRLAADASQAGVPLLEMQPSAAYAPAPRRRVHVLRGGGSFPTGAPDTVGDDNEDVNNDSIVLLVELDTSAGARRALLLGDTEGAAQAAMIAMHCGPSWDGQSACPGLAAQVLKVAHHGSNHIDPRLIRAVSPCVALISAGFDNTHEHPRCEVVQALLDQGVEVRSTSNEGASAVGVRMNADGSLEPFGPEGVHCYEDANDDDGRTLASRLPNVANACGSELQAPISRLPTVDE